MLSLLPPYVIAIELLCYFSVRLYYFVMLALIVDFHAIAIAIISPLLRLLFADAVTFFVDS